MIERYVTRISLVFLFLLLALTATAHQVRQQVVNDLSFKRQQVPVRYFSAINVSGNFQVRIHGHQPRPCVTLSGGTSAVNSVSLSVVNQTLTIRQIIPKNQHSLGRVNVIIDLPEGLNSLITGGTTVVRGENITSRGLNIVANDQSSIYLHGDFVVRHLQDNSSGRIDLAGLNNGDLLIDCSGSGVVHLTGSAAVLTAHLAGNARLEAQGIRAREVYVSTHDHACAKVFPLYALYAFADDYSNIFYFNRPRLIAGYTRCSGNVLYIHYLWNGEK